LATLIVPRTQGPRSRLYGYVTRSHTSTRWRLLGFIP